MPGLFGRILGTRAGANHPVPDAVPDDDDVELVTRPRPKPSKSALAAGAKARFEACVEHFERKGQTRAQAIRSVATQLPVDHRRYIETQNAIIREREGPGAANHRRIVKSATVREEAAIRRRLRHA